MPRKYTNYENMKFKKRLGIGKTIVNTFLAGAVSGALTLGFMQGLSGCKDKGLESKINETNAVVQEVDVEDVNENNYVIDKPEIIDYKTEDFSQDSDKVLLARMIYGEARNCTDDEKIAVAYTAVNRANDNKKWNGETLSEAILKPWQYSCFNENDVNLEKLKNPDKKIFKNCLEIAGEVLDGKYDEFNFGQTHYHTKSVHPYWADSDQMIKLDIKNTKHEFYVEK